MSLVIPTVGKNKIMSLAFNKTAQADLVLHLYANNLTPTIGTVLTDLTEASGGGYSSVTLGGTSWTISSTAPVVASHIQTTFSFANAIGDIYGYFITVGGTDLLWVEKFTNGPYNISSASDKVRFTPSITFGDN